VLARTAAKRLCVPAQVLSYQSNAVDAAWAAAAPLHPCDQDENSGTPSVPAERSCPLVGSQSPLKRSEFLVRLGAEAKGGVFARGGRLVRTRGFRARAASTPWDQLTRPM
jgi:hypothetical protein